MFLPGEEDVATQKSGRLREVRVYEDGTVAFILGKKRMRGVDERDEEQRKEGGPLCSCEVGK